MKTKQESRQVRDARLGGVDVEHDQPVRGRLPVAGHLPGGRPVQVPEALPAGGLLQGYQEPDVELIREIVHFLL